jgi:hypothetical protein
VPKIEAWKCPHSGMLFEVEKEYKSHLRALSRQRARQAEYKLIVDNIDDVILGERQCESAQELCEYVLAHSKEYMIKGLMHDYCSGISDALQKGHKMEFPKYTGMKIFDVRWNNLASNSHSAPRGKKQNFCGQGDKDGIPKGYPGWCGNIRIWHDKDARIVVHDPKKKRPIKWSVPSFSDCTRIPSGIQTGSGGGRDDGSYYSVTLFAEDFPAIEKLVSYHMLCGPVKKEVSWNTPSYPELDKLGEGRVGHVVDGDPF